VEFTQFDKIDVNGANASPLYSFLKSKKGFAGFKADAPLAKTLDMMLSKKDANYAKSADIKWNFTKFLISRDGRVIKRYEPTKPISEVETDIMLELNPVTSAIMGRRSIRKYLDTPVEHEKLAALARCAINAPSGMNMQPWVVRIVESQELINKATEVYKKVNAEQVKRDSNFKNMFRNAPNLICVCTPTNGSGLLDAGLLGENVMVAAHSMGLGTCCLGGPVRFLNTNADTRFFIDSLNIPAGYSLSYIIAVGYPDECPDARPRDESKVAFIK
jgi:nitroreductase